MKLPAHKGELSITHNEHKSVYQTVEKYIARNDYYRDDSFPEGEKQKCIDAGELWTVHWYPETPVGFRVVHASTLEAALKCANEE